MNIEGGRKCAPVLVVKCCKLNSGIDIYKPPIRDVGTGLVWKKLFLTCHPRVPGESSADWGPGNECTLPNMWILFLVRPLSPSVPPTDWRDDFTKEATYQKNRIPGQCTQFTLLYLTLLGDSMWKVREKNDRFFFGFLTWKVKSISYFRNKNYFFDLFWWFMTYLLNFVGNLGLFTWNHLITLHHQLQWIPSFHSLGRLSI